MKKILVVQFIILLFSSGCYYDKYNKLYPPGSSSGCDSINVTYSSNITTILSNYCQGCHNALTASGGIVLDNYSQVKTYVTNGKLIGSVKQLSGYISMPPGAKLSDCDIAKLQKWVNDGSPNN